MKKYRIAPEVREQIINRIKNEGITVAQASKDHGVSDVTIYKWLGSKADGPTYAEIAKELRGMKSSQKSVIARELGISRGMLYYRAKKPDKDWRVKCSIEEVLREYPSYGHKRLAIHLRMNHKKILRVMKLYGIKPYRRRGKKPFKINKKSNSVYPNLLLT